MAVTPDRATDNIEDNPRTTGKSEPPAGKTDSLKTDLGAPAGSKNSLGAESVRDGRPATKDDVVEAIDEEGPGIPTPPFNDKANR